MFTKKLLKQTMIYNILRLLSLQVRLDKYDHRVVWAQTKKERRRCRVEHCTLKTLVYCQICKVSLCMQKNRSCWDIWHYVATPDLKPEARKRPAGQVGCLNEVDELNVQSTSKRRRNMR